MIQISSNNQQTSQHKWLCHGREKHVKMYEGNITLCHFLVIKCNFSVSSVIASLTNNTGFGPGFSYSDWQNSSRDQSNLEPYWLAYRFVGFSFAELQMDKTVHLEFYLPLSWRSKHQFQWNISISWLMKNKIWSPWTSKVKVSSHEDSTGEFCCVVSTFSMKLLGFVSKAIKLLLTELVGQCYLFINWLPGPYWKIPSPKSHIIFQYGPGNQLINSLLTGYKILLSCDKISMSREKKDWLT